MGAQAHDYPASDDQWLRAAGFNPDEFPGQETLLDYFTRKTGLNSPDLYSSDEAGAVWQALDYDGWMGVARYFSLKERFELFGVEIISEQEKESDGFYYNYAPRTITFSNGMILKEVRDHETEEAMYEEDPECPGHHRYKLEHGLEAGYDFVSVYMVVRVSDGMSPT